jgi:hypothetical protein
MQRRLHVHATQYPTQAAVGAPGEHANWGSPTALSSPLANK